MKIRFLKISIFIFCLAVIWARSSAQKLPAQFHFSEDGSRLIRGDITHLGFYNQENIDTIFLTFKESNYWSLLTAYYDSSLDLTATLKYKDITYDSIGVRFKGLTSYVMVNGQKKSFNITLDAVKKDQNIEGYSTFNLNNAAEDPSFMREFLYNYFQSKNVPSARTNYKVLMLNNVSWGLYVNVQQLDKQHAREWFCDADATRWRALSPTWSMGGGGMPGGGGVPGGGGIPGGDGTPGGDGFGAGKSSLNYLGTDTSTYIANYTLKKAYKENPWDDLVEACRVLNTVPKENLIDSLSQVFDIDGALWFLAHEIIFTDDDSYINKGGMDYYVYFDEGTKRIIPIEFDGNSSFTASNAKSWSPFLKESDTKYSLPNILFKVPELRQRYLAHVRTILEQTFDKIYCDSIIDRYASKIDSYVNSDTKKIYTYNQFKTDVTALKSFMSNRKSYYLSNKELAPKQAFISSVIYKAGINDYSIPDSTQEVKVTCLVTSDSGLSKVYLYFDKGIEGKFTKTEMYDDGLHSDGLSGDGIYGGILPANEKGKYMRFYIESVNADESATRTYSPAGAEHDVYVYRVKIAVTTDSPLVINEIMAVNNKIVMDPQNEYDDWIELYNNSESTIDLSGYFLGNSDKNLTKWEFPSGSAIGANKYLVIWADDDTLDIGLHTNFELSSKGEEVFLVSPEKEIIDQTTYNAQPTEVSFSRIPNGYGPFSWQVASPSSENVVIESGNSTTKISHQNEASTGIDIFPNPASESVRLVVQSSERNIPFAICNIYGRVMSQGILNGSKTIDVSQWASGIYFVRSNNTAVNSLIVVH